jgi:hypothetical protein
LTENTRISERILLGATRDEDGVTTVDSRLHSATSGVAKVDSRLILGGSFLLFYLIMQVMNGNGRQAWQSPLTK